MNITLFSQILQVIDRRTFNKLVCEIETDKHNKGITTWTHFVLMLFLHFAKANSN